MSKPLKVTPAQINTLSKIESRGFRFEPGVTDTRQITLWLKPQGLISGDFEWVPIEIDPKNKRQVRLRKLHRGRVNRCISTLALTDKGRAVLAGYRAAK